MIDSLLTPVGFALAFLVMVLAFLKGDEPERVGAGAHVLALFTALYVRRPGAPDWVLLPIDAILLAVFLWLAWKSRRGWLLWASGLLCAAMLGHLLPSHEVIVASINLAVWGVLLALAAGTVQAWRDRRVLGVA